MGSITEEKLPSFFPVASDVNVVGQVLFAESMQCQFHVIVLVFYEQDFNLAVSHGLPPTATALVSTTFLSELPRVK